MTNRFTQLFSNIQKKAFIPYFTLGDPNPEESLKLITAAIDAGADALELGIPFSDPVADGPTNQRAMARALKAGMTFDKALMMLRTIRKQYPHLPIGLLLYFNLIFKRGLERVYAELKEAGVDAIVSAELPLEEAWTHENALSEHNIGCVHMVFPNTPLERAKQSFERSTAFTYVVARSGTTGVSVDLASSVKSRLQALREITDKPIVVGFGLSKPEHVKTVWQAGANGAIVASRFSAWIEEDYPNIEKASERIKIFIEHTKS